MPAQRAKPARTPTPTPTPTLTWLLLGRVMDEGVVLVAVGEGDSPDDVDGAEDVNTVRLEELFVAVVVEA